MTPIKAFLFPPAVRVALLVSECEPRSLDEYWSGAPDDALSPPAIGFRREREIGPDACTCLLCSAAAPGGDDDADED
jgi:hypothetical protein